MEKERPRALINKYLSGKATAEEKAIVESWYLRHAEEQQDQPASPDYKELEDTLWPFIDERTRQKRNNFRLWTLLGSAAALAILILGTWVYWPKKENQQVEVLKPQQEQDIAPGRNTATITLPNGQVLELSDSKSGVVINASDLKYNDGAELLTNESGGAIPEAAKRPVGSDKTWDWLTDDRPEEKIAPNVTIALSNKLSGPNILNVSTPRGGTYQIELPDGSKVWLNAASSIRFPRSFKGARARLVELEGEAYFSVRRSPEIPFIVRSRGQEALVLGTEFNVNSYADEKNVVTSLVSGSLKVNARSGRSVMLVPGEESYFSGPDIGKRDADLAKAISWKKGTFFFDKTPFIAMMRQVSRWYNVDVVYQTKEIPGIRFSGEIKRDVSLQTVLGYLKDLGVKLRIDGRTLYIG